jgi:hypothetical protein
MARKQEIGIDYFPLNTTITNHPKIKLLINDVGPVGFWVLNCIWCEAYRLKGYYFDARDEDELILFASDTCKQQLEVVLAVINACVKRKIFNKEIYDKHGILTSRRMQTNYLEATSRRKDPPQIRPDLYLQSVEKNVGVNIIDENVDRNTKNVDMNDENVDSGTQSKLNKSRVNEIKLNESKGENETIPPELFKKLSAWIRQPKYIQKFYPQESVRFENDLIKWQEANDITKDLIEKDPEANRRNNEQIKILFKRHMGYDMTAQIEDCYTHYQARNFMIDGQPINNWTSVLSGWMKRRGNFQRSKAS